jgi:hypothetical protein
VNETPRYHLHSSPSNEVRNKCPRLVFVLLNRSPDELKRLSEVNPDTQWEEFRFGPQSWVLQTFLRLGRIGFLVELTSHFMVDAVNFCYNAELRRLKRPKRAFVVGIRADYPSVSWPQIEIVQNKSQLTSKAIMIPHWPQPGLLKREANRGALVRTVGYFGNQVNHYTRFIRVASGFFRVQDTILAICEKLGLAFVNRGPGDWNDFSDIDVIVGMRAFGNRRFDTKPSTKLVNAWLAGAPFIGGADSAFLQIGIPEFDYLVARTPQEFEAQLLTLVQDGRRYESIVKRGTAMARLYDEVAITNLWTQAIYGRISTDFEAWRSEND